MLTSLTKGGGGVSQLLTITDEGGGGVHTPPNMADIICEQSLTTDRPTDTDRYIDRLTDK